MVRVSPGVRPAVHVAAWNTAATINTDAVLTTDDVLQTQDFIQSPWPTSWRTNGTGTTSLAELAGPVAEQGFATFFAADWMARRDGQSGGRIRCCATS